MTKENLEAIKNTAIQLLYLDVKEGFTHPAVMKQSLKRNVIHPVFRESPIISYTENGQPQVLDILHDEKALETAREIRKEHILTCKNVGGVFFLIRKPWRLGFLKGIKKYLDNKKSSE